MTLPKNKKLPAKGDGGPGKNKGNGKGKGNDPKFFGGLGGYKGVKIKPVKKLMHGLMQQELDGLRTQKRHVNSDARAQRRNATAMYQRGQGDLNYVHGETAEFLKNLSGQNKQTYAGASSQAAQAQAA